MSQSADDKSFLKGAWLGLRDVTDFRILHPLNFSGMAEAKIVKSCARVGLKSISLVMTNCLPRRRGQDQVTSKIFSK